MRAVKGDVVMAVFKLLDMDEKTGWVERNAKREFMAAKNAKEVIARTLGPLFLSVDSAGNPGTAGCTARSTSNPLQPYSYTVVQYRASTVATVAHDRFAYSSKI